MSIVKNPTNFHSKKAARKSLYAERAKNVEWSLHKFIRQKAQNTQNSCVFMYSCNVCKFIKFWGILQNSQSSI